MITRPQSMQGHQDYSPQMESVTLNIFMVSKPTASHPLIPLCMKTKKDAIPEWIAIL